MINQRNTGHQEIREEIKKFLEVNENGSTINQNLWDTGQS
jgi:hypothetical protein